MEESSLISHCAQEGELDMEAHRRRIQAKDAMAFPKEAMLEMLEQMQEFELGRFLLKNKGFDGYWTAYVILDAPQFLEKLHPLERWLVECGPIPCATRERFGIFQEQVRKLGLQSGVMASIPCGRMDDLLSLYPQGKPGLSYVGIDLDEKGLKLAAENAQKFGNENVQFLQEDAWNLSAEEDYDVVLSNGLNPYEPDSQRVTQLFAEFFKTLKPGGTLITSFLTPPPAPSTDSPWVNYNPEDLLKQKAFFMDIIEASWQTYYQEDEVREQLTQAGFPEIEVIYDRQRMIPTVVAKK